MQTHVAINLYRTFSVYLSRMLFLCTCVDSVSVSVFAVSPFSLCLSRSVAGMGLAVQGYLEVLLRGEAEQVSEKRAALQPNALRSPQCIMNSASLPSRRVQHPDQGQHMLIQLPLHIQ